MNWSKVTGYVGLMCIVIAALAQIIAAVAPDFHDLEQAEEIIRWSIYLWAYATVVTGFFLKQKTGHFSELIWGILASMLVLAPHLTLPTLLIYFFRAFAKLSKLNDGLPL